MPFGRTKNQHNLFSFLFFNNIPMKTNSILTVTNKPAPHCPNCNCFLDEVFVDEIRSNSIYWEKNEFEGTMLEPSSGETQCSCSGCRHIFSKTECEKLGLGAFC